MLQWPRRAIPFCQSQHFQSSCFKSGHFPSGFLAALCVFLFPDHCFYTVICDSGKETHVLVAVKRSVTKHGHGLALYCFGKLLVVEATVYPQVSQGMK